MIKSIGKKKKEQFGLTVERLFSKEKRLLKNINKQTEIFIKKEKKIIEQLFFPLVFFTIGRGFFFFSNLRSKSIAQLFDRVRFSAVLLFRGRLYSCW